MNPDICKVLINGGLVSCFLTNQQGVRIDPTNSGSFLCQESLIPRENVTVTLPSGEQAILQKVQIIKQGYIVIEVSDQTVSCLTEPIFFSLKETVILCAPEGTSLQCHVTYFDCKTEVICQNGNFSSIDIILDVCQDIQIVNDTVIEISTSNCTPREAQVLNLPSNLKKLNNMKLTQGSSENLCISVSKVYDWIVHQKEFHINKKAEDIMFHCNPCTVDLFVPAFILCGRNISGKVHCGSVPFANTDVFFSADPNIVTFSQNPAHTDENGNYITGIVIPPGTPQTTVIITATTNIDGQTISTSLETIVECPAAPCTIELFAQSPITCEGFLDGRVFCGNTVIEGATIILESTPNILIFDPGPITTGSNGNYFSGIKVPPGTPSQVVTINASTIVNGQPISTFVNVIVECPSVPCRMILSESPSIFCSETLFGNISCGNVGYEGADIHFQATPNIIAFNQNPTTSDINGNFETTVIVPPGTPPTPITIKAITVINSEEVSFSFDTVVECPPIQCSIELIDKGPITCNGVIEGRVFCGDSGFEGASVQLLNNHPAVMSFDPNPTLTDSNGIFFTNVTIAPNTPSHTVLVTAITLVNGQSIATTLPVTINCPPIPCQLTLFGTPTINCNSVLNGNISCGGTGINGADIFFEVIPNIVTITPNPTHSIINGDFSTNIIVPLGTPSTPVTIVATTHVNGQDLSTSFETIVECQSTLCDIQLFVQNPITCNGALNGRVFCGIFGFEGAIVQLSSSNPAIVTFDPNPTSTDVNGNYSSTIIIADGSPSQMVTITASTFVNGQLLTTSVDVTVDCPTVSCQLTLTVPPLIDCNGVITGNISCGGEGINGASITFSAFPDVVSFTPNPTTSDINGDFTTSVTVAPNTPLVSVIITATTTVHGQTLILDQDTQVECLPEECPCKFRIGISGNKANATANITEMGVPSVLVGTINVTAVQCFLAGPTCNPNSDNFNITFGAGGGTNINFIQGRRIQIACEDHNYAKVHGTALANGLFNGIFEVTIEVSVSPSNLGTWTIFATDHMGNTFSTTFVALMGPTTFIGACGETP